MKLVLFPCSVPFLLFCNTVIKILIDFIILERIAGVFPTPIWCSSEPDPVMVCYVSMCGSRGTCPFLVLIQGCRRRSPAAHHNPAHHSPAHYSPSHPIPACSTPVCSAYNSLQHCRSFGLSFHFGKGFRGYFALEKK